MKTSKQKTKRERFETVAAGRVQKLLNGLEVLGRCSNTNNYEYDAKDVQKMFRVIKDKTRHIESLFEGKINRKPNSNFEF